MELKYVHANRKSIYSIFKLIKRTTSTFMFHSKKPTSEINQMADRLYVYINRTRKFIDLKNDNQ